MTPSPLLPPHYRPSSSSPLRSSSSPLKRTSPTEDVVELLELCRCHLPPPFGRTVAICSASSCPSRPHRVPAVAASGAPLPCPPAALLSHARLCLGRARVLAARIHACRRCPRVMLRHCGRPRPSIPPLAPLAPACRACRCCSLLLLLFASSATTVATSAASYYCPYYIL